MCPQAAPTWEWDMGNQSLDDFLERYHYYLSYIFYSKLLIPRVITRHDSCNTEHVPIAFSVSRGL
jgi:hypothetical protein